jgi:hypothetical protein
MSTNGIIARKVGEGAFAGRYHHWDSYPTKLGETLVELYRGFFKYDLEKMLTVLLDEHPAGWSTINGRDFKYKPGYTDSSYPDRIRKLRGAAYDAALKKWKKTPDQRRPLCSCHGRRHEESWLVTSGDDTSAQWAYAFDMEAKTMEVYYSEDKTWKLAGTVYLADPNIKIDWTGIECGQHFERCSHYAWYHHLCPKSCKLGTQTWLGFRPFNDFHDAIAVLVKVKGLWKRYKLTGSGGDSDFMRQYQPFGGPYFPSKTWVATVIAGNKCKEIPIAYRHEDGSYTPYENVIWVYPPTKNKPFETKIHRRTSVATANSSYAKTNATPPSISSNV